MILLKLILSCDCVQDYSTRPPEENFKEITQSSDHQAEQSQHQWVTENECVALNNSNRHLELQKQMELPYYFGRHQFSGSVVHHLAVERLRLCMEP